MMKQFEGRSLAHPGCLIGVTLGLIIGIILAGVLATTLNMALNTLLLIWLVITVGLGALGWVIGERLSSKFPAAKKETAEGGPTEPPSS